MTSSGRRWPVAISSASTTDSARKWLAIDQPTILPLQASSTTAKWRDPLAAGTTAMPAAHGWFGLSLANLPSARSGAGRASRSRRMVAVPARRRLAPGVTAGLRHAERAGHCGNRQGRLVRTHELEDPDGAGGPSRHARGRQASPSPPSRHPGAWPRPPRREWTAQTPRTPGPSPRDPAGMDQLNHLPTNFRRIQTSGE